MELTWDQMARLEAARIAGDIIKARTAANNNRCTNGDQELLQNDIYNFLVRESK